MTIGAIIIGDEILSGKRQDKHFAKVVELLGARGMTLERLFGAVRGHAVSRRLAEAATLL